MGYEPPPVIERSDGVVLDPEWGISLKPVSPDQKARIHALSVADPKQWSPANLASRYGINKDRVTAIIEMQQMFEDAKKAGTLDGEPRADQSLWDDEDWKAVGAAPVVHTTTGVKSEDNQDVAAATSENTKLLRFQLAHEGVTREQVMKVLTGLDAMVPEQAHAAPPEPKPMDPVVSANVSTSPDAPSSRFKFVFVDKKDGETFLTRENGKAELHSRVPPARKKHFKKRT